MLYNTILGRVIWIFDQDEEEYVNIEFRAGVLHLLR